jgi:hypothetical protein
MIIRSTLIAFAMLLALAARAELPPEPALTYTVQPGDKLIVIANKILKDPGQWAEVAQFNRMAMPNRISVGQTIRFPLRLVRWAPSAARLVSANGDVRINGAQAVTGASIAEGDQLQAGESSSAVIALEDGSRVQMMPRTLAELVQHRQYGLKDESEKTHWFAGLLRLTQGAVEAVVTPGVRRATPLQVTTPTSVVGVRGTHFRVAFEELARSEVIEGLVVAENPAQAAQADLSAGTGAVIRPEEKQIQVKTLLPAPDLSAVPARVQTQDEWRWPRAEGAEAWRVQLAADAAFNQVVREDKLNQPSWAMAGLPLGQWFARVRAIDNVGLEGFDTARAIEIVATPVPDWSLRSSALSFRNGISNLRWTPVEPQSPAIAGQWRASILRDGAPVSSTSVRSAGGSFTEIVQLTPGNYTVHIDGQDAQGVPFKRKTFRMAVPNDWGSTATELANPLQPTE